VNNEEKDCTWAGRLANRWSFRGDDGRRAWQACRAATMSCEPSLEAECADDPAWFKANEPANEPAKGLVWINL
jgi:hypothetical protein